MSLVEMLQQVSTGGWVAIILILGSLIEISPIKFNPWTKLANWFGSAINHNVIERINLLETQVKELQQKLDQHAQENELEYVDSCRTKIIDFAGEILRSTRHTREQYNRILSRIDTYENYCEEHPKFPNSQCVSSIKIIKSKYEDHMFNHDFLDSQGSDASVE